MKVRERVEWERHQAALKQDEEEKEERERIEYTSIDWHDFSVVETIDFQPWEMGEAYKLKTFCDRNTFTCFHRR